MGNHGPISFMRDLMNQLKYLVLCLAGCWIALVLIACDRISGKDKEQTDVSEFITGHWPAVLPPQGNPPTAYSPQEASLGPQDCGQCHVAQFEQWQTSLHSHTMGAGIQWQLQLMPQQQGNKCLRCHAPLAEQKALVALQQHWPNAPADMPPAWVPPDLANAGLVCASCHVRRHQRFGPPPRQVITGELPHGGFTVSQAFQDSRFCAACHQHQEQDKPPRINGKLQVDTWAQWQQSPQAARGEQCQGCHMPDRQHLWRGIHDPDMTRQALAVQLVVNRSAEKSVSVEAILQNRGAGHYFPTYMVPKIELVFSLRQRNSDVEKVFHRYVIGWQVNVALTAEQFDTRIPAGETVHLQLPSLRLPEADAEWDVQLTLDVAPREHYERTFRQSLKNADKLPAQTLTALRQALREAEATHYRLLQLQQPVPAWPIAK
jgi:hypothetical protein